MVIFDACNSTVLSEAVVIGLSIKLDEVKVEFEPVSVFDITADVVEMSSSAAAVVGICELDVEVLSMLREDVVVRFARLLDVAINVEGSFEIRLEFEELLAAVVV